MTLNVSGAEILSLLFPFNNHLMIAYNNLNV